jgi:hypothetical protein
MERMMTLWKTEHAFAPPRPVSAPAGYPDYAALAIIGAAPAVLLLWFIPLTLVLPALSIVSFAIAGIVALAAHCAGTDRRARGVTAWDISALFTAVWILAGLMSGPRPFAELFDRLTMGP